MQFDFEDQIVIVTGATRGIGKQIASDFQKARATLILTGTNSEEIDKLNSEALNSTTWKCVNFLIESEFKDFLDFLSNLKRVDVLINNAGINYRSSITNFPLNKFDDVLNVNLRSPFRLMQTIIPIMKKQKYGKIVNIASISSKIAFSERCAYVASKHGIVGLTKTLALECAQDNILINCVSPGIIETDLTKDILGAQEISDIIKKIPLGRLGKPSDISEVVLFLSDKTNHFITGSNIVTDGGFVIGRQSESERV